MAQPPIPETMKRKMMELAQACHAFGFCLVYVAFASPERLNGTFNPDFTAEQMRETREALLELLKVPTDRETN